MNVHQMVCHIGDQMRCAVGDASAAPRHNPLRNALLRRVVVHWLPWPKGMLPTAPEMQRTQPADWEADISAVETLLRRAAEKGAEARWAEHPTFGPLPGYEWGWLIYKHTDHHLRQFGV